MPHGHEFHPGEFENQNDRLQLERSIDHIVKGLSRPVYSKADLMDGPDCEDMKSQVPVLTLAAVKGRSGVVAYHSSSVPLGLQESFVYNPELGMAHSLAIGLPSLFDAVSNMRHRVYEAMYSMHMQRWQRLQKFLNGLRPADRNMPLGILVASADVEILKSSKPFPDITEGLDALPDQSPINQVQLYTHPAVDSHVILLDLMHKMNMSVSFS